MVLNHYHFVSHWHVAGTLGEVADISASVEDAMRWWPAVYLGVIELEPGDTHRIGKVVRLRTKGWLPYELHWSLRVVQAHYPDSFTVQAWGDLSGTGICTMTQHGPWVHIRYEWSVRADKPLLRRLSWLLWPVFAANHGWAMRVGERSLRLEVARRRAATDAERAVIPPPPPPTTTGGVLLRLAGATALLTGAAAAVVLAMSPQRRSGALRTPMPATS